MPKFSCDNANCKQNRIVRAMTGRKVVGREEWEAFIWLMLWLGVKKFPDVHVMLLKTCTWSALSLNQTSSEGHEILVKKEPCLLVEQTLHGRRKIIKYIHWNLDPLTIVYPSWTYDDHVIRVWLVCSKNRCLLERISWNFGILILVESTANKLLRDRVDPFVSATLTLMMMWS